MSNSVQSTRRPTTNELVISGCTAQDVGDRKEQQDRVAILTSPNAPTGALGVLADGMGGRSGGALAAENVVLTSARRFNEFDPTEPIESFFTSLVSEVHMVLRLTGMTSGLEPHSTFAAVLVQPDRVDWAHVGDSRIYHIRDRRLMHCTSDHTYMQDLIDKGKMSAERARLHPSANTLVNALGAERSPVPTLGALKDPQAGDTFLLCSDGLWNYFHSGEIVLIIESMPLREAAATLIARARERAHGHGDNCSLILLRIADAPAKQKIGGANLANVAATARVVEYKA
jgi:PPM family protein phosphatase